MTIETNDETETVNENTYKVGFTNSNGPYISYQNIKITSFKNSKIILKHVEKYGQEKLEKLELIGEYDISNETEVGIYFTEQKFILKVNGKSVYTPDNHHIYTVYCTVINGDVEIIKESFVDH